MHATALCASALALTVALAGAQVPESPAVWREVIGVDGLNPHAPRFTRPHMPGLRVTKDGRVGVAVGIAADSQLPAFALMIPEKLTQPFLLSTPGSHTMSSTEWSYLDNNSSPDYLRSQFAPGSDEMVMACLWDDEPPVHIAGADVYVVKVLVTARTDVDKPNRKYRSQLHVTPVRVTVGNPKTALARILAVHRAGPTVSSPLLDFPVGFEPVICGDGRLLVLRVDHWEGLRWKDPNTQAPRKSVVDVVYSYYPSGDTADPREWTNIIPVTFAPYDNRINGKFGFAMAPFKDPEGNLIPPGKDLGGSYPWIDREAKNLFIETLGDRSKFFYSSNPGLTRYPQLEVFGDLGLFPHEDTGGKHQGVSFLGLWSNGKLVMVDNLTNDVDYAMGRADAPQTRDVTLFDASRDAEPAHARLRLGYGRATAFMPPGENNNANILDSLEARFTYRKHYRPIVLQDVAWPLTTGKHTDELGFDAYVDPNAFLVASMAGSLTYVDASYDSMRRFEYHDGWLHPNGPFAKPIRLQNAANGRLWNVPSYGQSHGPSRLEPAAAGGIRGKGFWLTGKNGVVFPVPAQSPARKVHESDWYAGVFVDCRHDDDAAERTVMTFPDGTSVRLYGRRQVVFADSRGAAVHRITMPAVTSGPMGDLLPYRGWAHLALQIFEGGSRVDFHLNGLLYSRWRDPGRKLFQLTAGSFTLGKVAGSGTAGFHGWVDELKVFAHTFDPETLCNLAGGTLIGLEFLYPGEWRTQFADRYPEWVHDEISAELRNRGEVAYFRYASFHRYDRDHGVHRGNIPALTHSLRESMQFPEGPLFHNAPRPHSVQNKFCTSCHYEGGKLGLGLDALRWDPSLTAAADPRRQPMQPAARIHGLIPAGLVDTVTPPQPAVATVAPDEGLPIDAWMMPKFVGPAFVESFTVVDPSTGRELLELQPGTVLDPKALGLTSVAIRTNLNTAQGSVSHRLNAQQRPATQVPPHAQTVTLTPGTHTVTATPVGGTPVSRTFTVPGPGVRVIASYRDAFRRGSPARGWSYAWNDAGDVTSAAPYRYLQWSPTHGVYNARGLSWPDEVTSLGYGSLTPTGGSPGKSRSQQGSGHDRFVLAGYEVRAAGTYRLQRASVRIPEARSDGGRVVVLVRGPGYVRVHFDRTFAAGLPFTIPEQRLTGLKAGEVIHVGVGPNGNDYWDGFLLDFDIAAE